MIFYEIARANGNFFLKFFSGFGKVLIKRVLRNMAKADEKKLLFSVYG